jgi:hypothetical protein
MMPEFLYPNFLYALSAIAIPIIVHLFNFRKFKKVYFTNVKFLKEVKQETQSRSQLKHLLVLLMRILAIAMLVFAFAQPFYPAKNAEGDQIVKVNENSVSIYIDNSFSMKAVGTEGELLALAKKKATEAAMSFKATDNFQLITNDFEGRHQRFVNRDEFLELLEEVQLSPAVRMLSDVYGRFEDISSESELSSRRFIIFSDFQKNTADLQQIENKTEAKTFIVQLKAERAANLYIDSVWFESPVRKVNETDELMVRVVNNGDEARNISIGLSINGTNPALGNTISVDANSTADSLIKFTLYQQPGLKQGEVYLNGSAGVDYDDSFYFTYEVASNVSILSIGEDNTAPGQSDYIQSLFGSDDYFQLTSIGIRDINYNELGTYKLIVLNELQEITSGLAKSLDEYVTSGGNLVVFPGTQINRQSYNELVVSLTAKNRILGLDTVNTKVVKIEAEHPLYQNVFSKIPDNIDLPAVNSHYSISRQVQTNEEMILRMRNGDSFLSKYDKGNGKFYLFSVPLNPNYSSLSRHAIFVPTMLRIAEFSQYSGSMFYTIGYDAAIEVKKGSYPKDVQFHLKNDTLNFDLIPRREDISGRTLLLVNENIEGVENDDQVNKAAHYSIKYGGVDAGGTSFNYNRIESDVTCISETDLKNMLKSSKFKNFDYVDFNKNGEAIKIGRGDEPREFWWWCLIFALGFFAIETALIKLWK